MKTLAVIPARYGSTRFPAKVLFDICGLPLVIRVAKQVERCGLVDRLLVAVDDARVADVAASYGYEVVMTPLNLACGSDRVAYAAREMTGYDVILSVQADDPLVGPAMIDPLVGAMDDPSVSMAVLAKEIERVQEIDDPNMVKMIYGCSMEAIYFSRLPIPYSRDGMSRKCYKHIGPYAYRREFLLEFSAHAPTPLEECERLEMLRVLEMGKKIKCVHAKHDTVEIDVPQDVEKIKKYYEEYGDDLI